MIRLKLCLDICSGIGFVHSKGFVHRDIKVVVTVTVAVSGSAYV